MDTTMLFSYIEYIHVTFSCNIPSQHLVNHELLINTYSQVYNSRCTHQLKKPITWAIYGGPIGGGGETITTLPI